MSNHRYLRPQLEPVEHRIALSAGASHSAHVPHGASAEAAPLIGTLQGTFVAHGGKGPTLDNVFASGRLEPVGGALLIGGFPANGASGGNLLLTVKSTGEHLALHLTKWGHPSTRGSGQEVFVYHVAGRTGLVETSVAPIATNIHGEPVSNPGFFGNATLAFRTLA